MRENTIPKDQRKKILLLADDLRVPSGVGVMSKEIVFGTLHRYNWAQVAAAVQHPEHGRIVDASEAVSKEAGVEDAYLRLYPSNGYGDPNTLRTIIDMEKPDALMIFTDPRYFVWLFHMEHELRQKFPILYYNIWDDLPFPKYNQPYYRSCDALFSISKQTYNINKVVLDQYAKDAHLKYIPHGIRSDLFRRLDTPEDEVRKAQMKKNLFGEADVRFVVLYNNRNIRRKMTGDVILAYRKFLLELPEQEREHCRLVMHTQMVDDNGTDLGAVVRDCAPEIKVVFSEARIDTPTLNVLYNVSDVVINLASNEGFGLGTAEAIMAERMVVANVTGGLQDQMGFRDEDGDYLHEDIHYTEQWGTNADHRYHLHGPWVVPVWPAQRALIGSPPTPYIFDDRCRWEDAADAIRLVYGMSPEQRAKAGKAGREYLLTQGFSNDEMCNRFISGIDDALAAWKPRKRFELVKA